MPGVRLLHMMHLRRALTLATDVEVHHLEKRKELEFSKISVVSEGPLRAAVATEVKYGKSTIKVNVSAVPLVSSNTLEAEASVDCT
jgi:hypothetical protein